MTEKEMMECFGIMMTNGNWERASMFHPQKIAQTVQFWTRCLSDVDSHIAQMAIVKLCQECTYPPTIADFRAKTQEVIQEIESQINDDILTIRSAEVLYGSLQAFFNQLPPGRMKTCITKMGGPNALIKQMQDGFQMWNIEGYRSTYWSLIRRKVELQGRTKSLIEGSKQ